MDTPGKSVKVPDPAQRPTDLASFTFRSVVSANLVYKRASDEHLSLEFSLRLPRHFQPSMGISTPPRTLTPKSPSTTTTAPSVTASDTTLDGLGAAELRVLLLKARATHSSPIVSTLTTGFAPSNIFPTFIPISTSAVTSSSTPKMDRVSSVATSRGSMAYTGTLDFLDSQASFYLIFGPNSTMLRLTPGKNR